MFTAENKCIVPRLQAPHILFGELRSIWMWPVTVITQKWAETINLPLDRKPLQETVLFDGGKT